MIILLHIIVAFSSLAYTTYVFMRPSRGRLYRSYGLIAATIVSGTFVAWSTNAHMLQACVSGLLYIGAVSVGLVGARRKLAIEETRDCFRDC